ncbi:MAG: hypothetical protein ACOC4B_02490 [Bacteroidota bacterium]
MDKESDNSAVSGFPSPLDDIFILKSTHEDPAEKHAMNFPWNNILIIIIYTIFVIPMIGLLINVSCYQ